MLPPAPEPTTPPDPTPAMPVSTEDIPLPAGPITSSGDGEDSNPESSTDDTTQEAATEGSTHEEATGGANGDHSLWQETKSDEGYTYYWHTVTQGKTHRNFLLTYLPVAE